MTNFNFIIDGTSTVRTPKPKKEKKLKEYYDLQIYKACLDFIRLLYSSTQKAPNYVKFSLLADLEKDLINVMHSIRKVANSSDTLYKQELLKTSIDTIEKILVCVRVLYELRAITEKGFCVLSSKSEDIVRQALGWLKSFSKQNINEP